MRRVVLAQVLADEVGRADETAACAGPLQRACALVLRLQLRRGRRGGLPLGFGQWIEAMLDAGFDDAEVGRMVRENPAALLG